MNQTKTFEEMEKELAKVIMGFKFEDGVSTDLIVLALQKATKFMKKEEKKELGGRGLEL